MYMNGSGRPVAVVRTRNPYINATSKPQQAARSIRMRVMDGGRKTEKKTQENERRQENEKKAREHERARWRRRQEGRWSKKGKTKTKRDQDGRVAAYHPASSTQLAAGWPWRFRVERRRRRLSCIAAQQVPSAYRAQPTEPSP
ncbi:hypothetical protein DFH08DRAFT_796986 [Mycena albidolilacea]|uniref:Uncharacterized protein n=1 Tax=Mycena albidolilacea TaxID=1033008 RepID=A0AAD7AWN8_9AGAR|nr:hypothetical protein DFH08DRAFT_796986 [Mycena albidolilacea]